MAAANYNNSETERLIDFFRELAAVESPTAKSLNRLLKRYVKTDGSFWSKTELWAMYSEFVRTQRIESQPVVAQLLQMKPTRTISGVAPVTVLTKPFPCPGKCIFCPSDVRMPKSYLSNEPGAQRAEKNYFDPYLQTHNRIQALQQMGHNIDKIELIVLGGTWSYYPEPYQIWFIKECFRALNDFGSEDDSTAIRQRYRQAEAQLQSQQMLSRSDDPQKNQITFAPQTLVGGSNISTKATYNQTVATLYTKAETTVGLTAYQQASWEELEVQQHRNETASCRSVGLVIETRPDNISVAEVLRIRRLGCTKTQIGVQSLQDSVLKSNHRGHTVAATRKAFRLLRQAGFKIHAHWMPNLYGSTPQADIVDYQQLFSDPDFLPDELKIYPCSLIESAQLVHYFQQGLWRPYTESELLQVLTACFQRTPPYCRLTRVIRDIPSTDILVGNKKTNFRQIVEQWLHRHQTQIQEIRSREIRQHQHMAAQAQLQVLQYQTSVSTEYFLQFVAPDQTKKQRLLAFLRLSLPSSGTQPLLPELTQAGLIREIHVYGQAVALGEKDVALPQHVGYGKRLIAVAATLAKQQKISNLAVISAVGTREYYRHVGFTDGQLYQHLDLTKQLPSALAKQDLPNYELITVA